MRKRKNTSFSDNFNRASIRKFKKAFKLQGRSNEEVKQIINIIKEEEQFRISQESQEENLEQ